MMRQNDLYLSLALLLFSISISGCATHHQAGPEAFRSNADRIGADAGFLKHLVKTHTFLFTTYQKITQKGAPLILYIEGDGRSYITPTRVSPDPTPRNPMALKLAVLDRSPNIAYLARPCQYTPHHLDHHCTPAIWTDLRFSESNIRAINEAIETIKHKAKAKTIHLVGFSGGAAVAVLVAARRKDVATLRTVAGDLDHIRLSAYHGTTPLSGSLNPISAVPNIIHIPQLHFAGENDTVVPPFISEAFVHTNKTAGSYCASSIAIKGAAHHQGWETFWKTHNEKNVENHFPQKCVSHMASEFR